MMAFSRTKFYKSYKESSIDPPEELVMKTMDWMWDFQSIPSTPAILISGDIANDYLTFTRVIKWLSQKYEQVYFTLGNHDLIVRGATMPVTSPHSKSGDVMTSPDCV